MITRASLEAELVERCGPLLALVGKDGTTVDGTNAALTGPLRDGLGSLGLQPASFSSVTDADLADVEPDDLPQLLAQAELRILLNVDSAYLLVDEQVDRDSQKNSQIRDMLARRIADLRKSLKDDFGVGLPSAAWGWFSRDFAESDDCEGEF
jgi:hypothetical protein